MSRNIPVKDETYTQFNSIKDALHEILVNKHITNDTFIEMLINDFSLREKAINYTNKKQLLIQEVNNGKEFK